MTLQTTPKPNQDETAWHDQSSADGTRRLPAPKEHREIEIAFHAIEVSDAMVLQGTSADGLGVQEAQRRLAQFGYNQLREHKKTPAWLRFLHQFHDPLIYVLLATAGITAVLQHFVDTAVILGVVVINAIIGYIQEAKAEKAIDSIKRMLSPTAIAVRGGAKVSVPARELVPGDIVHLYSGDKVPADLRIVQQKNLQIDEAALTGESLPVEKITEALPAELSLGDRRNLAFAGTLVTTGTAVGMVTATGDSTELGRIAEMLSDVEGVDTPLIRRLAQFSKMITVVIVVLCVIAFGAGVLAGVAAIDMLLASVALAVSAIPEGLPAIMTIALAIGVKRMAARNAIIRKLPAVESLGSATVICSDKTGTLTRNEMTVTKVVVASGDEYVVSGSGYIPEGEVQLVGTNGAQPSAGEMARDSELQPLFLCGALCNDARLRDDQGEWRMEGDPTEGALVVLAAKAGMDTDRIGREHPRLDEIPFESELQYMATMHHDHEGAAQIYVKGAPEAILARCTSVWNTEVPLNRALWEDRVAEMARVGLRVLALARRKPAEPITTLRHEDICELELLGLVGMMDPPRDEAIEAIKKCHAAGIAVKMITGDHAATARSIAQQIGLHNAQRVLTGNEVDKLTAQELDQLVSDVNVFARVSPAHKLQFVQSLQRRGMVVAMTGDGVNDAPALKQADIGVAMGVTGTDVSKEAAEMVLLDDNFASIAQAVEEGRTVYNNLKKTILFILPTNGGECLTLIAALLLGVLLPILPLHILWINLVTTVALAITLAFDPADRDIMRRPPRDPVAPLIDGLLVWRVVYVSVLMALGAFGLFLFELDRGTSVEAARAVAVNVIVFFEVAYLLNTRHLTESVMNREGLFGNRIVWYGIAAVIVMQMAFTYLPFSQNVFGVAGIDMAMWGRIIAAAVVLFFVVELEKRLGVVWNRGK
jgi:potassium/sodium efflux P-type ATPase